MADLSKYFVSEHVTLNRSQIKVADYNPRVISEEERKTLKAGIKKFGIVGGIVVNKGTGYTIVSGHQRISCVDEIMHYDPISNENDYQLSCDLIDVDEKAEKELVILLNNPNAQGTFDWDKLGDLINEGIDWKAAGLTNADLSMAGVDFLTRTPEQDNMADQLSQMMSGVEAQHQAEVARNAEERAMLKQADREAQERADAEMAQALAQAEAYAESQGMTQEEKVQHMKDVKQQVKEQAIERAMNQSAYITLSFDNFENKLAFCNIFGFNPNEMMAKGEWVMDALENMSQDE